MDAIQCPACGAINPLQAAVCQECNEDLHTIKSVMDTANRHYNEALALSQSGRLDEATGQLEAAIAMSSHNPNYHLLLGTVYAQKEDLEEAVRAWERCLTLTPEMERAYRNIEKARQMQEEEEQERRTRPFFLTAVAAVIVAGFLLITTGFYAFQSFAKNGNITELIEAVNAKTNESNSWQQKYNTLNANFPQEGLQGLIAQITQWKTLAEQRAVSIDQLEKRYKDTIEQRNQDIQKDKETLAARDAEIATLKQSITQINPLRFTLTQKNKEVDSLQSQITELNATLESNKNTIEQLTKQHTQAKTALDSSKSGSQDLIQQVRSEYDQKIESLRVQIQQLLDQVAQKDRELSDMQYADNLVVDAIRLMEGNQFADASSQIQKALERCSQHTTALYYQQKIQGILNNPVERELNVQLNTKSTEMREQIRKQVTDQYISRAQGLLNQGQFDRSIEIARQTLAFLPPDSSDMQRCNQLIRQAEEDEATVTRQLSEARGYVEKQDVRKAKALLKDILRRAPSFEEAHQLMKQLTP